MTRSDVDEQRSRTVDYCIIVGLFLAVKKICHAQSKVTPRSDVKRDKGRRLGMLTSDLSLIVFVVSCAIATGKLQRTVTVVALLHA